MAPARNRTADAPTYQQILTKHGLLPHNASADEAWAVWRRICEDSKVRTMSQEIERPKHCLITSITAGYQHFGKVLSTLTDRQLNALKLRVVQ